MDTLSYKTISANKETVTKDWVIIDAENEILGRLASKAALLLRGKLKTNYTPHVDCGDNVVVINAAKVRLTGNKEMDKEYVRHSQYPGGQTVLNAKQMMRKKPTAIVEKAIKGMLPKNRLGSQIFGNLYVYEGPEHRQEAQKPRKINLTEIK
jgi:large subunit ribosomal protein L13